MKKALEQAKQLLKSLQENPIQVEELSKAQKCSKCQKTHDLEKRCWEGYKPVAGKKPYSKGSCAPVKKDEINLSEENPDEKADAKLGEEVEHLVEDHMIENKDAEMAEGHKIFKKDEMLAKVKALRSKHSMAKKECAQCGKDCKCKIKKSDEAGWVCKGCDNEWSAMMGDDQVPEKCPDCGGTVKENYSDPHIPKQISDAIYSKPKNRIMYSKPKNKIEKSDKADKYNYYIVHKTTGQIHGGNEFKSDAIDASKDQAESASAYKVVHHSRMDPKVKEDFHRKNKNMGMMNKSEGYTGDFPDSKPPKMTEQQHRAYLRQEMKHTIERVKASKGSLPKMSRQDLENAASQRSETEHGQDPVFLAHYSNKPAKKSEHQPHLGASKSKHQQMYDAKKQAESEAHLKRPEGEKERQERNRQNMEAHKKDGKLEKWGKSMSKEGLDKDENGDLGNEKKKKIEQNKDAPELKDIDPMMAKQKKAMDKK